MRALGKELRTKEDTYGGDEEMGENLVDLSRAHAYRATVQNTKRITINGTSHERDLHTQ